MRSTLVLPVLLVLSACDDDGADPGAGDAGPFDGGSSLAVLGPPTFDPAHGLFDAPFTLTLTAKPGARIRYTLDGSTPTPEHGTEYEGPLSITTTTVVRAVAFAADEQSATLTQTYIRAADVLRQDDSPGPGWPTQFAATDEFGPYPADYEMDPEVVRHPSYAGALVPVLEAVPSVSLVTDLPRWWDPDDGIYYNPNRKGIEWERPVSIEWLDPAGGPGFTENAGVRIHGQATRRPWRTPKKNFRLYFRTVYGAGKLAFPLFGGAPGTVARFDRILLRSGGGRSWPYWDRDARRETDYVNDEWARRAQLEMGGLNARGTFAHLYLNGLYWGLYNVCERLDEKFLVAHLGGAESDYDLIESEEDLGYAPVAEIGSIDAYEDLMSLLDVTAVSDALHAEIASRVDLVDLADFMILTHYIGKNDWPAHNWLAYRRRAGPDTRFRFIAWDNDSGLNKVRENNTVREFEGSPVVIFNRLVTHAGFRRLLEERLRTHVEGDGALSPGRCAERYRELTDLIDRAVIGESARWGDYSRDVYQWRDADPPKSGPAYLHSRDLPREDTDPGGLVADMYQKTWVQVRDEKLTDYCPRRAGVLVEQYRANGWIP